MKKIAAILSLGFLFLGVACETTSSSKSSSEETATKAASEDISLKSYYQEQLERKDLSPELRKYYEERLKEESAK